MVFDVPRLILIDLRPFLLRCIQLAGELVVLLCTLLKQ